MRAINIKWDIDFEGDSDYLPTEIIIPKEIVDELETNEDAISDYISNVTDYYHEGYDLEKEVIINEK